MPSLSPDERAWPPVLKAGWLKQTFVHWPFRPADVQAILPRGLLVDEYDDMAWVSLTPFRMASLRPPGVQRHAAFKTFPETNLRTYVRRPDGRDGIWFLTLEVGSATMLTARYAVGAPWMMWMLMAVKPKNARPRATHAVTRSRRAGSSAHAPGIEPW